jgi:uncharacterized protein with HEPN domain
MEHRNLKKLLFDVEKACKRIEKFVSTRSLDDFLNNEMLQSAALSRFATVSSMGMRLCHPRSSGES